MFFDLLIKCCVLISLAHSLPYTCRCTTAWNIILYNICNVESWSQFVEHINTLAHTQQYAHACTCLATYGVQDVEISQDSVLGSICITCLFAQGTSAQGCYISLLENHDSVVTNTTGLRIERGDSLNATCCIENLEGGLYHVVVYDIEADGTVDWNSRALLLTAALNWTSPPSEANQLNTGKSVSHATTGSIVFYFVCFSFCFNLHCMQATVYCLLKDCFLIQI